MPCEDIDAMGVKAHDIFIQIMACAYLGLCRSTAKHPGMEDKADQLEHNILRLIMEGPLDPYSLAEHILEMDECFSVRLTEVELRHERPENN